MDSPGPSTPRLQDEPSSQDASRSSQPQPSSPIRFATTTNAFGLSASPASPISSQSHGPPPAFLSIETSPPVPIAIAGRPRLRRPSMLSLAQNAVNQRSRSTSPNNAQMMETGPGPPPNSMDDREGIPSPRARNNVDINPFASSSILSKWTATPGTFLNPFAHRDNPTPNLNFGGLSTSTPPIPSNEMVDDAQQMMDEEEMMNTSTSIPKSPLRWVPSHLGGLAARRKGKGKMDENDIEDTMSPTRDRDGIHKPPFTGRPLPASLMATLISESSPLEHEMQSEARLQRLITSHPRNPISTPRHSSFSSRFSSRGRFPETVGDEDDDDMFPSTRRMWTARSWVNGNGNINSNSGGRIESSSDSDSDDMFMDDIGTTPITNSASESRPNPNYTAGITSVFAAGMNMNRKENMSSDSTFQMETKNGSGKSTPACGGDGVPTPPNGLSSQGHMEKLRPGRMSFSGMSNSGSGMIPSPGMGLPTAFGGLGMGMGINTPLGSPSIEKLELAASPGASSAISTASPSLMQYRDSNSNSSSARLGKRKAIEDRFDPYKRPRGSSPSFSNYPNSPIRSSTTPAIPIPQSPSLNYGLYNNSLASSSAAINLRTKPNHPYTRPMSSRSRQASPALSIGSNRGDGLSSSLGRSNNGDRGSFSLGTPFLQKSMGMGTNGNGNGSIDGGGNQPQLGALGMLSLAGTNGGGSGIGRENDRDVVEMIRDRIEEERDGEDMSRIDSGGMDED